MTLTEKQLDAMQELIDAHPVTIGQVCVRCEMGQPYADHHHQPDTTIPSGMPQIIQPDPEAIKASLARLREHFDSLPSAERARAAQMLYAAALRESSIHSTNRPERPL